MIARLRRRRPGSEESADAAAGVLQLAVLLQAGLAPARAWTLAADGGDAVAARVRQRVEDGSDLTSAIAAQGGDWREIAAAWSIAATVGAPLADTLRGVSAAIRDAQEAADDVRIALAEPAGTARLMSWLPLVAVGLGAALGFDTLSTLVLDPLGLGCLAAGSALIVAAHRWTSGLVRRAMPAPGIPGLRAELLAIALSGGVSLDRARTVVSKALGGGCDDVEVERVLELSRRAGVPAVELLRASASLARHRSRVEGRMRAAKLASRLLLPLGVCTLPAFLLLGVAPMLLSVMSTMSLSL
ncbi:type II secretion system F family protein [Microbacterium sp. B2969]|uniref:Type II secretion system F family protein n=1 Tax=Microbacterium alkaliflavum TaxID=3248839 RepID=A0ABW7Q375_9MICO